MPWWRTTTGCTSLEERHRNIRVCPTLLTQTQHTDVLRACSPDTVLAESNPDGPVLADWDRTEDEMIQYVSVPHTSWTGKPYTAFGIVTEPPEDYPPKFFRFRCCAAGDDAIIEWEPISADLPARSYMSLSLLIDTMYLFGGTLGPSPGAHVICLRCRAEAFDGSDICLADLFFITAESQEVGEFWTTNLGSGCGSGATCVPAWVDRTGVVGGNFPFWVRGFGFGAVGSKLYVFAGVNFDNAASLYKRLYEFDLSTNRWRQVIGNLPTPHTWVGNSVTATWNDKMYIVWTPGKSVPRWLKQAQHG